MYDEDENVIENYDRKIDFGLDDKPIFYLKQGCGACPETWDVHTEEDGYLGYLYVRHGTYSVWDTSDSNVFSTSDIIGDGLFDWDEREHWLKVGCAKLFKKYQNKQMTSEEYFDDE